MNKKATQSFLGKTNLHQTFIFYYAQIVTPLQEIIKKDATYKWDKWEKDAFDQIKQAIVDAPALFNPDFGKGFLLYTFASDSSIVFILTQKDTKGNE